jgi:small subunit ribosomal protein S20
MSKMRTQVKRVQTSLASGEKVAKDSLQEAIRLLDKAAQKGIVKRKTASRKISRLTRAAAKK